EQRFSACVIPHIPPKSTAGHTSRLCVLVLCPSRGLDTRFGLPCLPLHYLHRAPSGCLTTRTWPDFRCPIISDLILHCLSLFCLVPHARQPSRGGALFF